MRRFCWLMVRLDDGMPLRDPGERSGGGVRSIENRRPIPRLRCVCRCMLLAFKKSSVLLLGDWLGVGTNQVFERCNVIGLCWDWFTVRAVLACKSFRAFMDKL